jgi:hypothetical protein
MKKNFFLILCFLNFSLFAQTTSYSGKFESKESDNQNFVKQQLLKDAFDQVISAEMKKLNMNPEIFWQKYNQAFNEHFSPLKEKLEKKYGIDGNKKTSAENQKKFEEELRLLGLEEKENFGGIRKVIQSYSITRTSRSPQRPELRYIDIEAEVDKRLLSELYLNFTREKNTAQTKTLFLTTKLELENSSWTDLGVSAEADLMNVLNESWRTWFASQFKNVISEVEVTDLVKEQELSTRYREGASVDSGLWIRLSFVLKKVGEDNLVQTRDYKVTGDYNLVDLGSGKLVESQDLPTLPTQFSFAPDAKLSSAVASYLYGFPLSKLDSTSKQLLAGSNNAKQTELKVENVSSMIEVIELIELLGQKGMVKGFQPSLKSLHSKEAVVELIYQGSFEEAAQIIKGLNLYKMSNSKLLNVETTSDKVQISIR